MPTGPVAREEPGCANGSAGSAQIGAMAYVVVEVGGEWLRNVDRVFTQRDTGLAINSGNRGRLQSGNLSERLGIEQEQDAGDAVGQGFRVAGEQFSEPGQSLLLGDRGGRFRLPEADLHRDVELALLGPDEERSDEVASGGAGSEVFVDVLLCAVGDGAPMSLFEPGET